MCESDSFVRGSPNFDNVLFIVNQARKDTTIPGPSSARHRNAIYMAFCWRADDGSTLNAGLGAL